MRRPPPNLPRTLYRAAGSGRLPPTAVPDVPSLSETLEHLVHKGASGEEALAALAAHLPRPPRLPTRSIPALGRTLAQHYFRQSRRMGMERRQVYSDGHRHLYQNGHALVLWKPEEALPPGTYAFAALEDPECAETFRLGGAPAGDRIAEVFERGWQGPYLKVREEAAFARAHTLEQVVGILEGPAGVWGAPLHHLAPLLAVSAIQLDPQNHWVFAHRPGVVLATFAFPYAAFVEQEALSGNPTWNPHLA